MAKKPTRDEMGRYINRIYYNLRDMLDMLQPIADEINAEWLKRDIKERCEILKRIPRRNKVQNN